jgi:hypothetical protein
MPSSLHEALIEIFRHRPSLAAELLSDAFDVRVPGYEQIRLESGEFADVTPTQYREANALLEVLDVRGLEVPEDVRARIAACTDIGQLKLWIRRAATAHSIDEVFA